MIGQEGIQPVYNASKGAVRLLTKSTAIQYAREGIRVNSVHPGTVDLDILVNNAGIVSWGVLEDTTPEEWDRVMEVNAKGVFLGTKAAIPEMRRAGGGSIVNISSISGLIGQEGIQPVYNASKGAVRLLTKSTAIQYAKEGIRVNSVHPGTVATDMNAERRADPELYRQSLSRIPLGRVAEPEDIANAVLYLASDESSFVTGSELVIDGGFSAQ